MDRVFLGIVTGIVVVPKPAGYDYKAAIIQCENWNDKINCFKGRIYHYLLKKKIAVHTDLVNTNE